MNSPFEFWTFSVFGTPASAKIEFVMDSKHYNGHNKK